MKNKNKIKLICIVVSILNTPVAFSETGHIPLNEVTPTKGSITEHFDNGYSKGFNGVGDFNLKDMTVGKKLNIVGGLYAQNCILPKVKIIGGII